MQMRSSSGDLDQPCEDMQMHSIASRDKSTYPHNMVKALFDSALYLWVLFDTSATDVGKG